MLNIPVFNFPTTVVIVDDDFSSWDKFKQTFGSKYKVKCFTNAEDALEFIQNNKSLLQDSNFITQSDSYEYQKNHMVVDVDLEKVLQLSQDSERYNEISTVVIDYELPDMSGIDLCEKLSDYPVKKILLTAKLPESLVIQAFNEGWIDSFVTKLNTNYEQDVDKVVECMQEDFFIENTKNIASSVNANDSLADFDPVFSYFFNQLAAARKIKESFLIDSFGSRLLIDQNKQEYFFVVHNDDTLDEFVEVYGEEPGIGKFIEMIKARTHIPFLGEDDKFLGMDEDTWTKKGHQANMLPGRYHRYYWSLIVK